MNISHYLFRSLQCSYFCGWTAAEQSKQSEQWVVVALKLQQSVTRMLLGKLKEIEVIRSDKCSSSFVLPTDAVCCVLLHYALLTVNFT